MRAAGQVQTGGRDLISMANAIYRQNPQSVPPTPTPSQGGPSPWITVPSTPGAVQAVRSPWPPCFLGEAAGGNAPTVVQAARGLFSGAMGKSRVIETASNVHRSAGVMTSQPQSGVPVGVDVGVLVVVATLAVGAGILLARMRRGRR